MSNKILTTLLMLAILTIGILAGALGTGALREQRVNRFVDMPPQQRFYAHMKRIIRPTEEQRKAIDAALMKRSEQISRLQETYQSQIFAVYDSLQADFDAVLSEEQRARVKREFSRAPRQFAENHVDRLTHELNLTEEQREKIAKIMAEIMPRRERDWKGDSAGRREGYLSIEQRFKEMEEAIGNVLTPEQREKFRALRGDRKMFGRPAPEFQRRFRDREIPQRRPPHERP
jgi:DNA-binding MarR family transcriptional regulator